MKQKQLTLKDFRREDFIWFKYFDRKELPDKTEVKLNKDGTLELKNLGEVLVGKGDLDEHWLSFIILNFNFKIFA